MKKALILLLATLALVGCAKKAVVAPVPGQLNTFDAYAFRSLLDAQAAVNSFRADVIVGKVQETPALKDILNKAIADLDVAELAYKAWNAAGGLGSTTPVASAISQVQADITNISSQAGAK